ncbi:hypothetical protein HDG33_002904 [Paraburkholderia sp. Cpub6]|nr:hypothetical protein [Paraburkholderia sp. Cpub6]
MAHEQRSLVQEDEDSVDGSSKPAPREGPAQARGPRAAAHPKSARRASPTRFTSCYSPARRLP